MACTVRHGIIWTSELRVYTVQCTVYTMDSNFQTQGADEHARQHCAQCDDRWRLSEEEQRRQEQVIAEEEMEWELLQNFTEEESDEEEEEGEEEVDEAFALLDEDEDED